MPLHFKASGGGGDFKSVPSGSHIAVCDIVADMGLQPGGASFPTPKQKVYIRFEIPAERVEFERDGKKIVGPAVIGAFFTASMHEKATLRARLEGWRGRKFTDDEAEKFDVAAILGKGCMLTVVENVVGDRVYSNIASISPLPKGIPAPPPEMTPIYFADDNKTSFGQLPEWLRDKINGQLNKPAPVNKHTQSYAPEITDDDIPF